MTVAGPSAGAIREFPQAACGVHTPRFRANSDAGAGPVRESVPMTSRPLNALSAASAAPAASGARIVLDAARAASASVRLMPASLPVAGRPDPAYAGAGR